MVRLVLPLPQGVAAEGAGKHRLAEQLFHNSWEAAERENLEEAASDILIYQAAVEMNFGLPAAARTTLAITRNTDQDSPDLAIVEAQLGDLTVADKFIAAHGPDSHPGTLMANEICRWCAPGLRWLASNALDAIAALEPAVPFEMASYTVPSERAEAWMAANRPDMAATEYHKILSNRASIRFRRFIPWPSSEVRAPTRARTKFPKAAPTMSASLPRGKMPTRTCPSLNRPTPNTPS